MRLTIDQEPLDDLLGWVGLALPKRPEHPVMAGIRLITSTETLEAEAYDLETGHTGQLDIQPELMDVDTTLETIVVSGHMLRGLVATLKPGPVELESTESQLSVSQGRTRYRLGLMRAEDWPGLPDLPPSVGALMAADLLGLLPGVAGPVDESEAAPTDFRGLRVETHDSTLTLVGASRQVVAVRTAGWSGADMSAQVPLRALENALRGFDPNTEVSIGLSDGLLGLLGWGRYGQRAVTSRLYAGKPMPWARLLRPAGEDTATATLPAGELVGALRRAALLGGEDASTCLTLLPRSGLGVEVVGTAGTPGDGADELDAITTGTDPALLPLVVSVNATYLADSVAALLDDSDDVRLGFAGQRQPITIRPAADPDDDTAVTVLAPRTTN